MIATMDGGTTAVDYLATEIREVLSATGCEIYISTAVGTDGWYPPVRILDWLRETECPQDYRFMKWQFESTGIPFPINRIYNSFQPEVKFYRRLGFPKSGYLPARIRKIRRDKQ